MPITRNNVYYRYHKRVRVVLSVFRIFEFLNLPLLRFPRMIALMKILCYSRSKSASWWIFKQRVVKQVFSFEKGKSFRISDLSVASQLSAHCLLSIFEVPTLSFSTHQQILQTLHIISKVGDSFIREPPRSLLSFLSALLPVSSTLEIPSMLEAPSSILPIVHGILPRPNRPNRPNAAYPFSLNPSFFQLPFSPGESPLLTEQRINPDNLPSKPDRFHADRRSSEAKSAEFWSEDLFLSSALPLIALLTVKLALRDYQVSVGAVLDHVEGVQQLPGVSRDWTGHRGQICSLLFDSWWGCCGSVQ